MLTPTPTPTITPTLSPPLTLGSAVLLAGSPYACPGDTTGQICYDVQVTCPTLIEPDNVTLEVGDSTNGSWAGTVLFFSGVGSNYFWANSTARSTMITDLHANGYKTVQAKWINLWYHAKNGIEERIENLSCRPATIAKWVYDNLHQSRADVAFCGEGHSNGGAQLAYPLARYGMANYYDGIIIESGPNFSRQDQYCLWSDPAYSNIWADSSQWSLFDNTYGWGAQSNLDPCYRQDSSYLSKFLQDSLEIGGWQFNYPHTQTSFLFGELDNTVTANQGKLFYNQLAIANTPYLSMQIVPGTGHWLSDTAQGMAALESTTMSSCVVKL